MPPLPSELTDVSAAVLYMVRKVGDWGSDTQLAVAFSRHRVRPSPRAGLDRWSGPGGGHASLRSWVAAAARCATCARCPVMVDRRPHGDAANGDSAVPRRGDQVLLQSGLRGEDDVPAPGDHLYVHGAPKSRFGRGASRGSLLEQTGGRRLGCAVVWRWGRRTLGRVFRTRS